MKRSTTAWFVTAALLILIGGIVFIGVMSVLKFDIQQVSTNRFETNRYVFEERIQHVAVNTLTADIVFVPSESNAVSVECHEQTNVKHAVTIENGTLTITVCDTRKWYEHISFFNLENATITVALPKDVCGALTVETTTGDVEIPRDLTFKTMAVTATTGDVNVTASVTDKMALHLTTGNITLTNNQAGSADLSVKTGRIIVNEFTCGGELSVKVGTGKTELSDVTCQTLTSSGTTGDLSLENVVAAGAFHLKRTTGDVHFDRCDAVAITVNVTTGDVTGTLLTDKTFVADSTTGRVRVPQTTGGTCNVTATTGDITLDIAK